VLQAGWLPTRPVKIQTHFGAALRRLRNDNGLTQEELAFRADLSVVYLRGLEGGRFNPTLNVIFDLGKALSVHPSELLKEIPLDAETRDGKRKRPGPAEGTVRGGK
jgi:transcriptional regulator with XRE-family HTH domain